MQGFGGPLPAKPRGKRQGETDQRQIADQYLLFDMKMAAVAAFFILRWGFGVRTLQL
jgi:hypothetical protein